MVYLLTDCFMLFSCMGSLYILDVNPLSELLFANIFHLVGCRVVWWVISFDDDRRMTLGAGTQCSIQMTYHRIVHLKPI